MGKLSLSLFVLGVAACGSDNKNTADAGKTFMDAPPKVFMDAPPKVYMDAPPVNYDFTCFGVAPGATATDPVTVAGTTDSLGQNGLTPLDGVTVDFFKTGDATSLHTVTSANGGVFASGDVATGGTPLDAYIRAVLATYRTTYLYPPRKVTASLTGVPVPMISTQLFGFASQQGAGVTQDDTANGSLLVIVSDCALTPISGATLIVKQGNTAVGTQFDLGALAPQAAGTFFVFNVPDGSTDISATYNNRTFPVRTVAAHKAEGNAAGTITATDLVPGG